MDAVKRHTVDKRQRERKHSQTQNSFISAAHCEELKVSRTRGRRGGRGDLCDITASLTHPSGRAWEVTALTHGRREFTGVYVLRGELTPSHCSENILASKYEDNRTVMRCPLRSLPGRPRCQGPPRVLIRFPPAYP